jgi:hypothetical protein
MSSPELVPSKFSNLRRSQRVCLSVPIVVLKSGMGRNITTEETRTLIVSAHGAMFVLGLPVETGETLTLKHHKTEEELACRVVNIGPAQTGKHEIAVEFERPSPRFWRIAFPPADWSPRSPEAKPPTQHSPMARVPPKKPLAADADNVKKEVNKPREPAPSAGS